MTEDIPEFEPPYNLGQSSDKTGSWFTRESMLEAVGDWGTHHHKFDIVDTNPTLDFPALPIDGLPIIQHGSPSITQDILDESNFVPNNNTPTQPQSTATPQLLSWRQSNHPEIAQHFHQFTDSSLSSFASSSNSSITTIHKTHTNDINNNYNINNTNYNTSNIIVLTLATYLELDEEDQQKLWLQAQASNNTNLINRSLPLQSNNLDIAFPKLIKELLTQTDKNNIPELRFDPHPNKWCLLYTNWLARLLPIIKMFSKTSPVYDNETIILFDDPLGICNQALYMLITTKVDNFYWNMLHSFTDHHDQALQKLLAVFFPSYLHTSRLLPLKNYLISYISTPSLVNIYYCITLLNLILHLNPSFFLQMMKTSS